LINFFFVGDLSLYASAHVSAHASTHASTNVSAHADIFARDVFIFTNDTSIVFTNDTSTADNFIRMYSLIHFKRNYTVFAFIIIMCHANTIFELMFIGMIIYVS
jgi:hypothetical protein